MSHAQQIRDWLLTQDGPRTVVEIAIAMGRPGDAMTYQSVHRMWRDGLLSREGRVRHYRFAVIRDAKKPIRMPRDEQLRRNAEAARKRHSRRGGMSAEQWQAECARRTKARLARYEAEKAARAEARAKEREQRQAERAAAREAERAARAAARQAALERRARAAVTPKPSKPAPVALPPAPPVARVIHLAPSAPAKAAPRVETIDEFTRRGGKVERLHPAACSQPLKRIGWQPEKRRKAA